MKRMTVIAALLLAGCGAGEPEATRAPTGAAIASAPAPGEPDGRIFCAPPGEAEFRRMCTAERASDAAGTVLTVRLPDGGFHRLRISADGREIAAADGAAPAIVRATARGVEVEVGGARYRLPADPGAGDAPD